MRLIILVLSILMLFSLSYASNNIEEALRSYLRENYPWAEIEIKDLSFSSTPPQSEIKDIYIDRRPPGRTVFTIHFKSGEKVLATANIKAFEWVVMSKRPQGKGHMLKEEELYKTLMDVTKIPRGSIKDINEARGMLLKRSIIANAPLTQDMFSEGNMVKKGSRVTIVAESTSFVITTIGELKENGYVGSSVKALNLASRRMVKGILINENTLKVDF